MLFPTPGVPVELSLPTWLPSEDVSATLKRICYTKHQQTIPIAIQIYTVYSIIL